MNWRCIGGANSIFGHPNSSSFDLPIGGPRDAAQARIPEALNVAHQDE